MPDLAYVKLDSNEVEDRLKDLAGWSLERGQIAKSFAFETYKDGVVFAAAVGYLADKLNHHPDLAIGYRKVRVAMNTHDVGGLSPFDFELAQRIELL